MVDDGPPFLIYRGAIRSRRRYRRQERGPEGDYPNCDGFNVFATSAYFSANLKKKHLKSWILITFLYQTVCSFIHLGDLGDFKRQGKNL